MDEETKKTAAANAFRQRIAGLILSGDPDLADRAYREMQYVRALAGQPATPPRRRARQPASSSYEAPLRKLDWPHRRPVRYGMRLPRA